MEIIEDVLVTAPLKYLSNFWIRLEMPSVNCEINIFLTWSEKCITVTGDYGDNANNHSELAITLCSSCDSFNSR